VRIAFVFLQAADTWSPLQACCACRYPQSVRSISLFSRIDTNHILIDYPRQLQQRSPKPQLPTLDMILVASHKRYARLMKSASRRARVAFSFSLACYRSAVLRMSPKAASARAADLAIGAAASGRSPGYDGMLLTRLTRPVTGIMKRSCTRQVGIVALRHATA